MRQQRKYSYLISFFFNGQFDNIVLDAKRPISRKNIRNYEKEIESNLLCQDGYPNNLMGSLRIIAISPLIRRQRKHSYFISFSFNDQLNNIVLYAKSSISQENIRNYEAEIENTLLYQDGYPNNLMGSLRIIAISPLK